MWLSKLAALDMIDMGWLGRKTSTQPTNQPEQMVYTQDVVSDQGPPCLSLLQQFLDTSAGNKTQ